MRKKLFYVLFLCILCCAALQLRQVLIEKDILDGIFLETVAQSVRDGDVTAEDAVEAFCRYGSE